MPRCRAPARLATKGSSGEPRWTSPPPAAPSRCATRSLVLRAKRRRYLHTSARCRRGRRRAQLLAAFCCARGRPHAGFQRQARQTRIGRPLRRSQPRARRAESGARLHRNPADVVGVGVVFALRGTRGEWREPLELCRVPNFAGLCRDYLNGSQWSQWYCRQYPLDVIEISHWYLYFFGTIQGSKRGFDRNMR
jgi:hypothetical protein